MEPTLTPPTIRQIHDQTELVTHSIRIWNLPDHINPFFVDYQQILPEIASRLLPGTCLALSGVAGIGKTQLAYHYAYNHRDEYATGALWVNAQNELTLLSGYASLASPENLNIPLAPDLSFQEIVDEVKLELEKRQGWLLIFDNCDWVFEEELVSGLTLLESLFPYSSDGRILMTSRFSAQKVGIDTIQLEHMPPKVGAEFLLRRAGVLYDKQPLDTSSPEFGEAAKDVCIITGGLPLTLELVGAYIAETNPITPPDYLARYRNELFELRRKWGVTFTHESVAAACKVSLKAAVSKSQYIVNLVNLCVFFDPDLIPISLVPPSLLVERDMTRHTKINSQDYAYQISENYSLLKYNYQTSSLSMHRSVQDAIRNDMDEPTRNLWRSQAIQVLMGASYSMSAKGEDTRDILLPHWRLCTRYITEFEIYTCDSVRMLLDFSDYLLKKGLLYEAETVIQTSLGVSEVVNGNLVADTLLNVINLIRVSALLNKEDELTLQFQKLHDGFDNALAEEEMDPTTFDDPRAILYSNHVAPTESFPRFETPRFIRLKSTCEMPRGMIHAQNNLGIIYFLNHRHAAAKALFQMALSVAKRTLSADLELQICIRQNLASQHRLKGEYDLAEEEFNAILCEFEQLGETLNTAYACNHLGQLYLIQDRRDLAERKFIEALKIRERLSGKESYLTASSCNNLAAYYNLTRDALRADTNYNKSLNLFEATSGKHHPNTLAVVENYTLFLTKHDRNAEATVLKYRFE